MEDPDHLEVQVVALFSQDHKNKIQSTFSAFGTFKAKVKFCFCFVISKLSFFSVWPVSWTPTAVMELSEWLTSWAEELTQCVSECNACRKVSFWARPATMQDHSSGCGTDWLGLGLDSLLMCFCLPSFQFKLESRLNFLTFFLKCWPIWVSKSKSAKVQIRRWDSGINWTSVTQREDDESLRVSGCSSRLHWGVEIWSKPEQVCSPEHSSPWNQSLGLLRPNVWLQLRS